LTLGGGKTRTSIIDSDALGYSNVDLAVENVIIDVIYTHKGGYFGILDFSTFVILASRPLKKM